MRHIVYAFKCKIAGYISFNTKQPNEIKTHRRGNNLDFVWLGADCY